MINYYAVARMVFENKTSPEIQERTIYSPQMQSFQSASSEGAFERFMGSYSKRGSLRPTRV